MVREFGHAAFSYFKFKLIVDDERGEANISIEFRVWIIS